MKILLAEDEEQLSHVMKAALETKKYQVDVVFNGKDAVEKVKENPYDVIILDVMMPVMDGITALREIRKMGDKTYVMILTAKAEVDDKVTGLDSGADDYLTKPFSLKELLARLRSHERRTDNYDQEKISYGDLTLNNTKQELLSHNSIRLSNKEDELLNYLLLNAEKRISSKELLNHVWREDKEANEQVVWLYISYLRQKLISVQSKVRIEGHEGGNYKITK